MLVWDACLWLASLVVKTSYSKVKATGLVCFSVNDHQKSHKSMCCIQEKSWILSSALPSATDSTADYSVYPSEFQFLGGKRVFLNNSLLHQTIQSSPVYFTTQDMCPSP